LVTSLPYGALTTGEVQILIDGLSDEVSFTWALVHLGVRANPPARDTPPSPDEIAAAFASFERLVTGGFARLGRMEAVGKGQPGWPTPARHIEEPIRDVRERVDRVCRRARAWSDWAFCCWLVNTEKGHVFARRRH
jgi:hypothetical protein